MAREECCGFLDQPLLLPCSAGQADPHSVRTWAPDSALPRLLGDEVSSPLSRLVLLQSAVPGGLPWATLRVWPRLTFTLASLASRQLGEPWGASSGHAMLPASCSFPRTEACRGSSKGTGQDVLTSGQAHKFQFPCGVDMPRESEVSLLQTSAAGRSKEHGEVLWKLRGSCQVRGCAIHQRSWLECRALGQLQQARRGTHSAQERTTL